MTGPPLWHPPSGWAPDQTAPTHEVRTAPAAAAPTTRSRSWLVLGAMAALLAIYLGIITYWLGIHVTDRYEQTTPGEVVTSQYGDYTLLELRRVPALPQGPGETADPEPGEAYVLATMRVVARDPESIAATCALDLLGADQRVWEYAYQSALDPQTEDADYCASVRAGEPATVTLGYAIPATDVDKINGVVVNGYNGSVDRVMVPPD